MRVLGWFLALAAVVGLLAAAYTWFVLTWSYSTGERAGYVQKLSRKGWICKTWEGELAMVTMPGTMTEKFLFSVRDDAVAEQINRSMGRRVSLHYEEHVGVPTTCFAETPYFITAVRVVEDPHIVAPLPTPAAPPQPPAQQAPAERPPDGPQ
ncbi:MAG TPA: hypothetical protein VNM24_08920 [Burkholderiales bacterium]|jgi:hypothetical protein|nr:hypothetical protein [Burkholderiales bacterium]